MEKPVISHAPGLALFDFDGTLTYGDSLFPFLREASGLPRFLLNIALCSPTLVAYRFGWMENHRAKEKVLRRFLKAVSAPDFRRACGRFAEGRMQRLLNSKALERVRWHQSMGHKTVLISASLEDYLLPWAKANGFDLVVCTRLKFRGDAFTGDFEGGNCHGEEKVRRLKEIIHDLPGYVIYAYGDSRGDLPMLELAEHRFYRSFQPGGLRGVGRRAAHIIKALIC